MLIIPMEYCNLSCMQLSPLTCKKDTHIQYFLNVDLISLNIYTDL